VDGGFIKLLSKIEDFGSFGYVLDIRRASLLVPLATVKNWQTLIINELVSALCFASRPIYMALNIRNISLFSLMFNGVVSS
jgi:hypothetical protein